MRVIVNQIFPIPLIINIFVSSDKIDQKIFNWGLLSICEHYDIKPNRKNQI